MRCPSDDEEAAVGPISAMKPPSDEEAAVGPISVLWDMMKCPVPDGYDARRVGPRISGFLRKLGYYGPITITAYGILSKFPEEILEAISSTGISLFTGPYERKGMIGRILSHWPPYNLMVISSPDNYSSLLRHLVCRGLDIILPYPDSPVSTDDAKYLWKEFLMADPEDDDKCCETGEPAFWVCAVCRQLSDRGYHTSLSGRGFTNFIAHISSQEHQLNIPDWFPDVVAVEANVESPLDKATSMDSEDDVKKTGDEDDLKTTGEGREEDEYMTLGVGSSLGPFVKTQKTCFNTMVSEEATKDLF